MPTSNPLTSEYASIITYDRASGKNIYQADVRQAGTIHVVVDTFRKLHFGYFAGLPSKIIWCVLGLSPFWLSMSLT